MYDMPELKIYLTHQEALKLLTDKLVPDTTGLTDEEIGKLNEAINIALVSLQNENEWDYIGGVIGMHLGGKITSDKAVDAIRDSLFRKQANQSQLHQD